MQWNRHLELEGRHATLSPSKYAWVNYDEEELHSYLDKIMDAALGTRLHALAKELILLGIKQEDLKQTLHMYVNDCIDYRMIPEQPVMATDYAFGTADAIWFGPDHEDEGRDILRIFDLKNGSTPASIHQLQVYAAYFCIEYKVRPLEINYDLRLYQNDDIIYGEIDPTDILYVMDQTIRADRIIRLRKGV